MSEPRGVELVLPWGGMSKPRPRVTENGTFMPPEYVAWKGGVAQVAALQAKSQGVSALQGPLSLVAKFYKNEILVVVSEGAPPRFGKSDLDNLVGGLMDALEDAGLYKNDRQIARLMAELMKEEG